jgi:hypothetical protein
MEDQDKTREQIIKELTEMRLRVTGPEVTDVSPQLSAVFQCPIYDIIAFLVILPRITEGLPRCSLSY